LICKTGFSGRKLAPISTDELVARGKALAEKFRAARASLVLVNAAPQAEDQPRGVDEPSQLPKVLPEGFIDLAPGLAAPGDILITKSTCGAFSAPTLIPSSSVAALAQSFSAGSQRMPASTRPSGKPGNLASGVVEPHEATMRHIFPRIARITDADALAFRD
jgi:hypothetical protein